MRKNTNSQTELPLTISSKDGLVDQVTYFNKKVSSKDMSGYYLLMNGEFAYNKSYSVGYSFGSIKRLDHYPMGALSTLYICFALTQHNSDFMKVYFDSLKWYKEIYMIAAEGARNHGLLNVPTDEFFATQHILPPSVDEQIKIAKFLTLIEQRIDKQQRLVDNLKSYKRGVKNKLFGDFNNDWKEVSLSSILTERKTCCEKDGTYPHATLSKDGVSAKTERYDRDYLVSSDDKKYKITHYGDICYNPANLKFGVICLNAFGDAIFSPIYITFEVNVQYDKFLISEIITQTNFINKALQFQQGTVYERMAVSPEDLLSMTVKIPPISKQIQISKCLRHYDMLIEKQDAILANLVALKKSLLSQLFI